MNRTSETASSQPGNGVSLLGFGSDVSIFDIGVAVWKGKKTVAATIMATLLLAVVYMHVAEYKYTASLIVSPVQNDRSSLSGMLGGTRELAALGGISLPVDQSMLHFILYVEGLRTRRTAELLARDHGLMTRLFSDQWNEQAERFEEPEEFAYVAVRRIKSLLGLPQLPWHPPGAEEVHQILLETLEVTENSKKPIVKIAWENPDPALAAEFVQKLHETVDSTLRDKARIRAEENISHLLNQLEKVTVAEQRSALAQALSEQEKLRMAASATPPFAAEPYGRAFASSRPTSPRPVLVLALAIVGGGMIGTGLVLSRVARASRI